MKAKRKRKFFIILTIVVMLILNFKNILRIVYPMKYSTYIHKYSSVYNWDSFLVAAVIKTESNFDRFAKSQKNAYGLMQITEPTAKWAAEQMNIDDFETLMLYEPEFNINMGCWYLKNLRDQFGDNMTIVLAAYNGGRGNVKKWLQDSKHSKDGVNLHYIPFKETDKYIKKVEVNYHIYKFLYEKGNEAENVKKVIIDIFD